MVYFMLCATHVLPMNNLMHASEWLCVQEIIFTIQFYDEQKLHVQL